MQCVNEPPLASQVISVPSSGAVVGVLHLFAFFFAFNNGPLCKTGFLLVLNRSTLTLLEIKIDNL